MKKSSKPYSLLSCIRSLGFHLGWKYWNLNRTIKSWPLSDQQDFSQKMIDDARFRAKVEVDPIKKQAHLDWAEACEESFKSWTLLNKPNN